MHVFTCSTQHSSTWLHYLHLPRTKEIARKHNIIVERTIRVLAAIHKIVQCGAIVSSAFSAMPPEKIDVLSTVRKYNRDAFFGVAHKIGHLKNELNGSQNTKYFKYSIRRGALLSGSNTTSSTVFLS